MRLYFNFNACDSWLTLGLTAAVTPWHLFWQSLFSWQINKILWFFSLFSFTSPLNQSHQQPFRIEREWRLPPEISCIPSRHHPAAETVTNWYLEDMLLKIISFTFKDYTVDNKTRTAICKTWGWQIAGRNTTTSKFVLFEISQREVRLKGWLEKLCVTR